MVCCDPKPDTLTSTLGIGEYGLNLYILGRFYPTILNFAAQLSANREKDCDLTVYLNKSISYIKNKCFCAQKAEFIMKNSIFSGKLTHPNRAKESRAANAIFYRLKSISCKGRVVKTG
jgi:hypothetical protein